MTRYLYTFPASAMAGLTPGELRQADIDSHAEIAAAKEAGVYVFGGGLDDSVAPTLVTADGSAPEGAYPGSNLSGGVLVLELPDREAAIAWGARFAAACRCEQELRAFMFDPAS